MKGSINYQTNQIWNQLDQIKKSKKEARQETSNKGANGHKVSQYVHGVKYKNDVLQITRELGNFAKNNFNIKDMQQISNEIVHQFIHSKIEDGVTNGSLKGYISKLEKVHSGLNKMSKNIKSHNNLFDRNTLKDLRKDVDKFAIKTKHVNRGYINPQVIINSVKGINNLSAQLQFHHGLRVLEATQISSSQMLGKNEMLIKGKGGFERTIKVDPQLYKNILKVIKEEGSFSIKYEHYRDDLIDAVKLKGEKYTGTHGLRYSYAQHKFAEYSKTMPYQNALQKVSYDLGHKRAEITKHYLK